MNQSPSPQAPDTRRFLRADQPALTCARLFLARGVGQIIRNGLGLMGVEAVQEMH
jgi:arginyl-tRNA synthetase